MIPLFLFSSPWIIISQSQEKDNLGSKCLPIPFYIKCFKFCASTMTYHLEKYLNTYV